MGAGEEEDRDFCKEANDISQNILGLIGEVICLDESKAVCNAHFDLVECKLKLIKCWTENKDHDNPADCCGDCCEKFKNLVDAVAAFNTCVNNRIQGQEVKPPKYSICEGGGGKGGGGKDGGGKGGGDGKMFGGGGVGAGGGAGGGGHKFGGGGGGKDGKIEPKACKFQQES